MPLVANTIDGIAWLGLPAWLRGGSSPTPDPTPAIQPPLESAIQQLLRNNADITALVETRIHAGNRPQGDLLPSIVVRKVESGDDHDLDHGETYRMPQILVEAYAADYYAADVLSELIRQLEDHDGPVTVLKPDGTTLGVLNIDLISIEDENIESSTPQDGTDGWTELRGLLFHCVCDRP